MANTCLSVTVGDQEYALGLNNILGLKDSPVNVFYHQSGSPVSLLTLLNETIPSMEIPPLLDPLDLSLENLNLTVSIDPKGLKGTSALKAEAKSPTADTNDDDFKTQLQIDIQKESKKSITGTLSGNIAYKEISFTVDLTLDPNVKTLIASAKNLDLHTIVRNLTGTDLPEGIPQITISTLNFTLSSDKSIAINGRVNGDWEMPLGDTSISIKNVSFNFSRAADRAISCSLDMEGSGHIGSDFHFPRVAFHFSYGSGDWKLGGELVAEVLNRYLNFKANAATFADNAEISFTADFRAIVRTEYFEEDINTEKLFEDLKAQEAIKKDWFLEPHFNTEKLDLGTDFTEEQKERIIETLKNIQSGNIPHVPDPLDFTATPHIVRTEYFTEDINTEELFEELKAQGAMKEDWFLEPHFNTENLDLETDFTEEQKEQIVETLKKVQSGNILHVPDLLDVTANPHIADFTLHTFVFKLHLLNRKLSEFSISGSCDFALYSPIIQNEKLLNIQGGTLSLTGTKTEKALRFSASECSWTPLTIIPNLPEGIRKGMIVGFDYLNIKKTKNEWNLSGACFLQIEETMFKTLPGEGKLLTGLFPKPQGEEKRSITGIIAISSKEGIDLALTNNNALTPNPSAIVKGAIESMLSALEPLADNKQELKPIFDGLTQLTTKIPDTGRAYCCLQEVAIRIKEQPSFDVKFAFGLPENLNELIFDPIPNDSPVLKELKKLKGLIRTYNPHDPANSVMTASLSLKDNVISGNMGNFPPVNWTKAADLVADASTELKNILVNGLTFITDGGQNMKLTDEGIATEQIKSVVINFDGLTGKPKGTYGEIAIAIPQVSLSFKTGDFLISGGFEVKSEQLNIPLPFQPLFLLLGLPQAVEYFPESIPVRSVDFIENGNLSIDELEKYLLDCLPEEFKESFKEALQPFKNIVNTSGNEMVNKFPNTFKDYFGIKLPKGFSFELNITADKSVTFMLEVASPKYTITAEHLNQLQPKLPDALWEKVRGLKDETETYKNEPDLGRAIRRIASNNEWRDYSRTMIKTITAGDFHDAIQILIPEAHTGTLIGLRLRRIAFGTALLNQVFRVDFSGEINAFNLAELASGLLIPAQKDISDDTLRFILPDPQRFQKSILLDDLIIFIIYYTGVPIPIPVYARELNVEFANLLGDEEQLRWVVEANAGMLTALKKTLELENFITGEDNWLDVQNYPLGSSGKAPGLGLSLGPSYIKLPGIFGYEHDGNDNNKQHLTLGITEPIDLDFFDLMYVAANTGKAVILQEQVTHNGQKVPALNYLIQYLPLEKRVGQKHVKLFHLFDLSAKWLLTTPQEFRDGAWKQLRGTQSKDELLDLVSLPESRSPNEEGFVTFFQGIFNIAKVAYFDAAFAMAATSGGIATGFHIKGTLADVFSSELSGKMLIMPENEENPVALEGKGNLMFCGKEVLEGSIVYNKDRLELSGNLDLFPTSTLIRITGNINGFFQADAFNFSGDIACVLGPVSLATAKLTISNQKFRIQGDFLGQNITLLLQQKESAIRFFATMEAVCIGNFLSITRADDNTKGPIACVEMNQNQLGYRNSGLSATEIYKAQVPVAEWGGVSNPDLMWKSNDDSQWREEPIIPEVINPFLDHTGIEAWKPSGNRLKVYLSGKITLLGLNSTHLEFTDSGFSVNMSGKLLDIFSSELTITGKMKPDSILWEGDDSQWEGNEQWRDGTNTDWKHLGYYTFNGSVTLLRTSFKSKGELSVTSTETSGNFSLDFEGTGDSIFKDCKLYFDFQKGEHEGMANLVIHGNFLASALNSAMNTAGNVIDTLSNEAQEDLNALKDETTFINDSINNLNQQKDKLNGNISKWEGEIANLKQWDPWNIIGNIEKKLKNARNSFNEVQYAIDELEKGLRNNADEFLTQIHTVYNHLTDVISGYVNDVPIPIEIKKTSIYVSLDKFEKEEFDARIEFTVKGFNKRAIGVTIDFQNLEKTAYELILSSEDLLDLEGLPLSLPEFDK